MDPSTVAAADIARLAGVGRAAVSNWRRRFPDFPAPVAGTAASPLFRLADVEHWLAEHGRAVEVSSVDRLWQRLRTDVDDVDLGELIARLGSFAAFLHRAPARWAVLDGPARALGEAVAVAVPELPDGFPAEPDDDLLAAVRGFAEVAAERGAAGTYRFLVERYLEAQARRLPVTPPELAALLLRLADIRGESVLDPACRTGSLLTAADDAGAATVSGQESDPALARLAGAQLLLRSAGAHVAVGDALRADAHAGRVFGAVVCHPPWGDRAWGYDELTGDPRFEYGLPPRGEPELAWVQHCLAHAEPGGRVVLALPAGVSSRRPGRRIRSNLLRTGALRAVVEVPVEGSAPCHVWVLRRPQAGDAPPTHLLVSGPGPDPAARWASFVADPTGADGPGARAVPVVDLLDDAVDLTPARHLPAARVSVDPVSLRDAVTATLEALPDLLPPMAAHEPAEAPLPTTVGELSRAGIVTIAQAPVRMTADDGEIPVLTLKDVQAHRAASGRAARQAGTVALRRGDVVLPIIAGADAAVRVIDEEGAVLGPRLVVLRPDPDRLDPEYLAGLLRVAVAEGPPRSGSGSRTDVRRLPVTLLPPVRQRELGAAFRRLAAFRDALHACVRSGEDLVRAANAGLAAGRLSTGA